MIVIYRIISPSGKIYIGQTWNWKQRYSKYSSGGSKFQRLLYRSFSKYGIKNHKFEIILEFPNTITQDVLNFYEIYWWKWYKFVGYKMLNIREPGSKGKASEETKKRMSISSMGKKWSVKTKEKFKAHPIHNINIVMLNLDGSFVKEFRNTLEAAKELNTISTAISKVTKGIRKSCQGYRFMLKKDYNPNTLLNRIVSGDTVEIIQCDMDGNEIKEFLSVKEAEKELNKIGGNPNIIACCKGRRNYAYGYKWKYKNK